MDSQQRKWIDFTIALHWVALPFSVKPAALLLHYKSNIRQQNGHSCTGTKQEQSLVAREGPKLTFFLPHLPIVGYIRKFFFFFKVMNSFFSIKFIKLIKRHRQLQKKDTFQINTVLSNYLFIINPCITVFTKIWSSKTELTTNNNNKCYLSSKSAY